MQSSGKIAALCVACLSPFAAQRSDGAVAFHTFSDPNGTAVDVSADGTYVTGQYNGGPGYRWAPTLNVFETLPSLPGGTSYSTGYAISADGSAIAGRSDTSTAFLGFRWTAATGSVSQGDLPGGGTGSAADPTATSSSADPAALSVRPHTVGRPSAA